MRARVTKTFRFEAAHRLYNHDGQCRNLHGHSYRVMVECQGTINEEEDHPKEGMVIDFADIKEVWETFIKPLVDHQNLNDTIRSSNGNTIVTTSENIASWMVRKFNNNGVPVRAVTVWETETSSATVLHSEEWANG